MALFATTTAVLILTTATVQGFGLGPFNPFELFSPHQAAHSPEATFPQLPPPVFAPGFGGVPLLSGIFRPKHYPPTLGRLLHLADSLPQDLRQQVNDLLEAFEQGNEKCESDFGSSATGGPATGHYWRCIALNRKETESFARALETEVNNRATSLSDDVVE